MDERASFFLEPVVVATATGEVTGLVPDPHRMCKVKLNTSVIQSKLTVESGVVRGSGGVVRGSRRVVDLGSLMDFKRVLRLSQLSRQQN